jgi:aspartyl/asparaginyl-tRNA synthetase
MEQELLVHLGYDASKFVKGKYLDVAKEYGTKELENEHETKLYTEKTPSFFLTDFPEFTSPFWNMKRNDDPSIETANKIDVILSGQETIGSAEREIDTSIMVDRFKTIMNGAYKDKMYELFGEERTMAEMDEFLKFNFIKRSGGGIGVTRLIRSMKLEGLMK